MRRNRGRDGGKKREGEHNEGVGKREERDKVVGKREKGMVSTFPFLEGHLLLASQTFFQLVSKEKKKE